MALAALIVSALTGELATAAPTTWSASGFGALAYLIAIGSVLGFAAYGWLLEHVRPVTVSSYAFVNPVVAVLLGAWLVAEPITPRLAVALLLTLAGVLLVVVRPRPATAGLPCEQEALS